MKLTSTFHCTAGLIDGNVVRLHGIAYKEKLWLVLGWRISTTENTAEPERLIRFDNLPHQADAQGYSNILLPITAHDLQSGALQNIEVEDRPSNLKCDSRALIGNLN